MNRHKQAVEVVSVVAEVVMNSVEAVANYNNRE